MDQLSLSGDSDIKKILENGNDFSIKLAESIILSCKVEKYNKYDWKQERVLLVSEYHIFSLNKKSKNCMFLD